MPAEITPWAREVIARSVDAAKRLNPGATVRLSMGSQGLSSELTDEPADGDVTIDLDGRAVYVAADVHGVIDVQEPHDRVVLRAPGSEPNPRSADA